MFKLNTIKLEHNAVHEFAYKYHRLSEHFRTPCFINKSRVHLI